MKQVLAFFHGACPNRVPHFAEFIPVENSSSFKNADVHFGKFGQEPGQHFWNDNFLDSFSPHQQGGFAHESFPSDRFSIGDVKYFVLTAAVGGSNHASN